MKKILLTFVLLVGIAAGLFAQKLTYQAVIRDNSQQLVVNTDVKATVTITFTTGDPYSEEVNGSTNIHGLLSIEFGDATLVGRDWTGATIAVKVVNAATPSTVYVNDDARPVSAVPYALSVNGQSIQNYLTEHNYVDKAELDNRHYLTSDSTVITTMRGTLQQLSNQLDVQIAKLDSIAHIVDSLSKLPHGSPEVVYGQPCPGAETVTDAQGNTYPTVKIGNQCWMAKNLRTTTSIGSTKYPNNSESYVSDYGLLYNWAAVMQNGPSSDSSPSGVQGICPSGWHVPSNLEWTELTTYVKNVEAFQCGGDVNNIANALSAATGWSDSQSCCPGHNSPTLNKTGFAAVPAGDEYNGNFRNFGNQAIFWSTSKVTASFASKNYLDKTSTTGVSSIQCNMNACHSVRCLKN